jgi:2-polyprenyl-3-methyl-5-hydroxy-6-metoxy-1,4-benzoquinol methylase
LEPVHACPFCGSSAIKVRYGEIQDFYFQADEGTFEYVRCQCCESVWLTNRPFGERLIRAYRNYYTREPSNSISRSASLKEALRAVYVRSRYGRSSGAAAALISGAAKLAGRDHIGTDHFYRFAPKVPARVLDYGCGNGDYLLRLQPVGYEVAGMEFDALLLDRLTEHGILVADVAEAGDVAWDGAFDHITLSHVLEHVPDPHDLLARLFRWLKPGGTLFVEVPNAKATGLTIFGRYWRGFEAPRHFALPSPSALVDGLRRAGFGEMQQYIGATVRERMWEASLQPIGTGEAEAAMARMLAADAIDRGNAELLTFVATKPRVSSK